MTRQILLSAGILLLWIPDALAQQRGLAIPEIRSGVINDLDQSAVAMHPATPYLEASTVALVDIDLEKIDADAVFEWIRTSMGGPEQNPQPVAMVRGYIDSLKGAGVEHIFVTAATRSTLDGGPLVILPCENAAVVNGLVSVVMQTTPKEPPQKVHVGDETVLAGPTATIDRVTQRDGVERPDLILPLRGEERLDHQLVISMPDEAKSDLVALWPEAMPKESPIQFSPRALAADITSIVVSWRLPPDPLMLVHIDTPHAGAAERVEQVLSNALNFVGSAKSKVDLSVDVATVKMRASPEAFALIAKQLAGPARASANQASKMNALKQVGLAIHNYYDKSKHLPPIYFTDPKGTPLVSWRVAILPFIEQTALYNAMQLDQSWDSEDNRTMTSTMIPLFCDMGGGDVRTTIRVPVYPGSLWHGDGPPREFKDVRDGTSNTIAAIDAPADSAVEWAKPDRWVLSVDDPMSDVFGNRDEVAVVFLDGSARVLKRSEMSNDKLKALLTINGRETIEW